MGSKDYKTESPKETLQIERFFSSEQKNILDTINWKISDAKISDPNTNIITFEQKNVEFPDYFSPLAIKVVASKYFYGEMGTEEREFSVKQLFGRTSSTIAEQGRLQGYFDEKTQKIFEQELLALGVGQYSAFNSPFWFNVGTYIYPSRKSNKKRNAWIVSNRDQEVTLETKLGDAKFNVKKGDIIPIPKGEDYKSPQTSACFIQRLEDSMEDIMRLAVSEAMLFKYGSGTGTDLSTLRSSREKLSGGGKPSGPLKYEQHYDRLAGVVQSGGKTRRAAKMNSLKINHPDIKEFIMAKTIEENKIRKLIEGGIDPKDARDTVAYQNVNFSIRINDEFMNALEKDEMWKTVPIHNMELAENMPNYKAKDLFRWIAEGTHVCGDPGIQYHTTINKWHTCPNSGPINASNPCSEYMFIDDSSCNLASHNLVKFLTKDNGFDIEAFTKAIEITAIAQDILYDFSSFPEKEIAENSHKFRPLGMGYSNLGSLLMRIGLPYDSNEARNLAAAITSLMTATAYETSAKMAQKLGAFEGFEKNKEPMLNVIKMHKDASSKIDKEKISEIHKKIVDAANAKWKSAYELGSKYGFRNAQATVLAPTGTISFMMDCDTTGIEPDLALVKYKSLAGGGLLKIVNESVGPALKNLGYNENQIKDINKYILGNKTVEGSPYLKKEHYEKVNVSDNKEGILGELGYPIEEMKDILYFINGHETIEGSPHIKPEHLPIFDCSFKPTHGKREIDVLGHVKMMSAVQPFISGAISKTVNMSKDSTVEQIEEVYKQAHKLGLKAIAIYRDDTKADQPLTLGKNGLEKKLEEHLPVRRRLPDTRHSITHKFGVAGHEGYLTVGLYEDNTPGELFITMAKEGSTVGGLMDVIGTETSMALQYGVPLLALCNKFIGARFEPSGMTQNKEMPFAKSLIDYIFRWLKIQFVEEEDNPDVENNVPVMDKEIKNNIKLESKVNNLNTEGKTCINCGNILPIAKCGSRCPNCQVPDYTGCEGDRII